MKLDRRQLLSAGGGLLLASCRATVSGPATDRTHRLDRLLEAHADCLPERPGAGANHFPMAAEALEALGHEEAIEDSWDEGAAGYAGALPRVATIDGSPPPLGSYGRFGDWLDRFRAELVRESWHRVVARWAPRLAPGISGAAFHGVIRTGHAARALRQRDTAARRNELAVGLAYWAARYVELPVAASSNAAGRTPLEDLEHPWLDDVRPVDFFAVLDRMTRTPIAPAVSPAATDSSPRDDLDRLVHEAATAFLEMLVLERYRIWLLHTVTGPAAVGLLLPEVDREGARRLVEYARQAVVAMYVAYGAPFTPREHLRASPPPWPTLIQRAVETRSVHTIKLTDALVRFDARDDPLLRTVAAQWLEWT